ncbi:MAG TPA: branched-chain amino acid ABC transporter permease, partial [Casimicrobiaceae bacterium]|nr:branched-chain amino acid ABC transporter permease [Casimicrobiaceae bacterium]
MSDGTALAALAQDVREHLARRRRWRPAEYVFWALALATVFLLPGKHLILTEIAILGLFALSLDLILGYAGILSLGHAAFFGLGAYAAGLLALHGIVKEPVLALLCSGLVAAILGFATSFLVLRGTDLTRLMVTLGVALLLREIANRYASVTGGADGLQGITMAPVLGAFAFDIAGHVAYAYSLAVLFILFLVARRLVHSPFGLSLRCVRGNALRASAIGIPVNARRVAIYTIAAFYAGVAGALLTQTTQFCSLDVL